MTETKRGFAGRARDWLLDPQVRDLDVDSPEFSLAHRRVMLRKPLVQQLFRDFYRKCREADEQMLTGDGIRVEIGSGSGFMSEYLPDVITSDIKALPFVQLVCRGEEMPFPDASVRALYAINTFHHLPTPRIFFSELVRILQPGGGAIFIEPYYGPVARQLFKRLHASEGFDESASGWEAPPDSGPFSRANQALSYIVFKRDRRQFETEFPRLSIVSDTPHTHLRYVLSGGVNFRQLIPTAGAPLVNLVERVLSPLNGMLALQHTIVLRKSAG